MEGKAFKRIRDGEPVDSVGLDLGIPADAIAQVEDRVVKSMARMEELASVPQELASVPQERKSVPQERKPNYRARLNAWRKERGNPEENYHTNPNLAFRKVDIGLVMGMEGKQKVHHSSTRHYPGGVKVIRQGSRYYVVDLDTLPQAALDRHFNGQGGIAWVRVSNHWGWFWTRDAASDTEKAHNWELVGDDVRRKDGAYKQTSQAGYIRVADDGSLIAPPAASPAP